MSGNTEEKKKRVIPKIIYKKCEICKCKKKEEDMMASDWCNDCFRKQSQNKNVPNSFAMRHGTHPSKKVTEHVRRKH